ncbi:hypothetical protein C9374_008713 [Naegleria lovaniensis]|uniref:Dynein regulatory complex protein 1 n=1 Tax=Naegleria lovaniensis TaxID=51637 RepID=A0AA88GJ05_NAELO|nr:uncharacterized protein C9374_008713 [Naegleria lovaniensis]KAG2378091.1 hypothetical protein C9374_008713 [Naegleria lovaniensis]
MSEPINGARLNPSSSSSNIVMEEEQHETNGEEESTMPGADSITTKEQNEDVIDGEENNNNASLLSNEEGNESPTVGSPNIKDGTSNENNTQVAHQLEVPIVIQDSRTQIDESVGVIKSKIRDGTKLVTNVKVESDMEENKRRLKYDVKKEEIQQKLKSEAIVSSKKNAAIQMKWPSLYEKKTHQELMDKLLEQQEMCLKVIESKQALIKELGHELKQRDEEYVKALKKQTKDLDTLIERMNAQVKDLTDLYTLELTRIETSFEKERKELIKRNLDEFQAIAEERSKKEENYALGRIQKVDEYEQQLKILADQEMEKYAKKKKELLDEIHEYEQEIDSIRGEYQLMAQKLEYYFEVLVDRVEDNKTAVRNNRALLAKLQDQLSGIKAKYIRDDNKYKAENNETTEQFKRLSIQYKDLLQKFKYFEEADTKKYKDIWKMNQEIVEDLAEKLKKADEIITTQQLGLKWIPPEEDIKSIPEKTQEYTTTIQETPVNLETSFSESVSESSKDTTNNTMSPAGETVRLIFETLCDSAGFLVEEKVEKLLLKLPPDESKVLKVDNILRVIGIDTPEETTKMINFFSQCIEEEKGSTEELHDISTELLIKILRKFVEEQNKKALMEQNETGRKKKVLSTVEKAKDRKRKEEREFWKRMAQIIPESRYNVWGALERGLEKYGELLAKREKLITETEMIRKQNNELRDLLNQYMQQKINEELLVPTQKML